MTNFTIYYNNDKRPASRTAYTDKNMCLPQKISPVEKKSQSTKI